MQIAGNREANINLRSNEFHSGAVSFSFFEKDIF